VPRLSSYELHAVCVAALGAHVAHVDNPHSPVLKLALCAEPCNSDLARGVRQPIRRHALTNGERMAEEIGSEAEIGRRLGVSPEREPQWASDPGHGFPQSFGRMGGAKVWLWPEGVWWAERCAVRGPSCRG
jgi:hypothetical protein